MELRRWQAEALPLLIEAVKQRKRPVISAFMGAGKSVLIAEMVRRSREQAGRGVVVLAPRIALVGQLADTFGMWLGKEQVGQWWGGAKAGDRRVTVATYQSLPTLVETWKAAGRSCSLLVCDEAHRTEAGAILEGVAALESLDPGRWMARVGVTATPFRSDKKETLSLWDSCAYRYSFGDALRDGVIVPPTVVGWDKKGDRADLDAVCARMLLEADRWPALANAKSVEDAEAFAGYLGMRGMRAATIHSRLPEADQTARLYGLRTGAFQVLVHVAMLSEGSDFPWLRTLLLRRNVGARVRFIQEVGRVLRVDPHNAAKVDGLVLDPTDLMGLHGLRHGDALLKAIDEGGEEEEALGKRGEKREKAAGKQGEAVGTVPLRDWLRMLVDPLGAYGLDLRGVGIGGVGRLPPLITEKQVAFIERKRRLLRYLPAPKAKKRLYAWMDDGRIAGIGRIEAGMLIALLLWLEEATRAARTYAATTGDFGSPMARWEWPEEVEVPSEVPSLDDSATGADVL